MKPCAAGIVCFVSVLLGGVPAAAADAYTDAIVAIANGEVITLYDLQQEARLLETPFRNKYTGEELEKRLRELRRRVAERLVARELVYAEFEELGGRVPPQLLQKRIDGIVLTRAGGDKAKFEDAMFDQGMSMDDFEQEVEKRLAVELLLNEKVYRNVLVSPTAVRDYYHSHPEEYRVASRIRFQIIMLKKDGRYADSLAATAELVLQDLSAGKDFADLAGMYSEHSSAETGGDLGWVETANANPDFLKAVAALQPDQVAKPLRLDGNVFILKLTGREEGRDLPLDDAVRAGIEARLRRVAEEKRYEEYVQQLRQKYHVKTYYK